MIPTPRIVIHESGDAPTGHRFVGGLYVGNKRLPMTFCHDDKGALIGQMQQFWVDEQTKRARRDASSAALAARSREGAVLQ